MCFYFLFFFFKQKTAYEMRISDWSSDVCSSDLLPLRLGTEQPGDDVAELMERLGIDHLADRFPDEVSLGEQQRTALARAAVVRPRVQIGRASCRGRVCKYE